MQSFNLSENIVSAQFYVAPPKLLPTASQASKALHCDVVLPTLLKHLLKESALRIWSLGGTIIL